MDRRSATEGDIQGFWSRFTVLPNATHYSLHLTVKQTESTFSQYAGSVFVTLYRIIAAQQIMFGETHDILNISLAYDFAVGHAERRLGALIDGPRLGPKGPLSRAERPAAYRDRIDETGQFQTFTPLMPSDMLPTGFTGGGV
jgi:hypothetical protein